MLDSNRIAVLHRLRQGTVTVVMDVAPQDRPLSIRDAEVVDARDSDSAHLSRSSRQLVFTSGADLDVVAPARPVHGDEIVLIDADLSWVTTTKRFLAVTAGRRIGGQPGPLSLAGSSTFWLAYNEEEDDWFATSFGTSSVNDTSLPLMTT